MQDQLFTTYVNLMERLADLPETIAGAQEELSDYQFQKRQAETELAKRENDLVIARGGWAELGKNEGDRKINLANLLARDSEIQRWQKILDHTLHEIDRVQIDLDRYTNEFSGVRHGARLHAAWLDFLASGGPVNGSGKVGNNDRHTNGTATVADAEAIGL